VTGRIKVQKGVNLEKKRKEKKRKEKKKKGKEKKMKGKKRKEKKRFEKVARKLGVSKKWSNTREPVQS